VQKEKLETINFFGLYFWLTLIVISLGLYFFRPDLFSPERIRELFAANIVLGLISYFVISTLRGFTLIPSTPIVFAGILVFPPGPLYIVNLIAVFSSSAIVYYMARVVRFDHYFHERYPEQIKTLTTLLHRRELPVIAVWGFAPMVPTDMIVYVCSVLRINLAKTLFGTAIGEGVICAVYIFAGTATLDALFG
jgi:uncharacterized membrane protein YdjX (TVP38/TMEM64 family)